MGGPKHWRESREQLERRILDQMVVDSLALGRHVPEPVLRQRARRKAEEILQQAINRQDVNEQRRKLKLGVAL